jgi:hypothetical protein
MRVWLTEEAGRPTLLIDREDRGPFLVVTPDGPPTERWTLPETTEPLMPRAQVLEDVTAALEEAKLSKAARSAVEKAMDDLSSTDPDSLDPAA